MRVSVHTAGHLGAVFRTVLETMRTLFVWLVSPAPAPSTALPLTVLPETMQGLTLGCWTLQVDLLLFYTRLGGGTLGESWSVYSYIQALGCAVVIIDKSWHRFSRAASGCRRGLCSGRHSSVHGWSTAHIVVMRT